MANSLNRNSINSDSIVNIISSENFGGYDLELQKQILNKLDVVNQRNGGFMGKFFGTQKELASMNIAATICIILILICLCDIIRSFFAGGEIHMDLISAIIPVVSLSLGFIFGKSGEDKSRTK